MRVRKTDRERQKDIHFYQHIHIYHTQIETQTQTHTGKRPCEQFFASLDISTLIVLMQRPNYDWDSVSYMTLSRCSPCQTRPVSLNATSSMFLLSLYYKTGTMWSITIDFLKIIGRKVYQMLQQRTIYSPCSIGTRVVFLCLDTERHHMRLFSCCLEAVPTRKHAIYS